MARAHASSTVEEEELPLLLLASLYVRASGLTTVIVYTWMAKGKIAPIARVQLEALQEEVEEAARRQLRQLRDAERIDAERRRRAVA